MKKELEDKIFKRFPTLFPNGKNAEHKQFLIGLGIYCSEGWYNLIYNLCEKIEKVLNEKINGKIKESFQVVQIEEKFGALRFCCHGGNKLIWDTIFAFEKKSSMICEWCGKPGKLANNQGWYLTLCKSCKEKRRKQMEEKMKKWKKNEKKV